MGPAAEDTVSVEDFVRISSVGSHTDSLPFYAIIRNWYARSRWRMLVPTFIVSASIGLGIFIQMKLGVSSKFPASNGLLVLYSLMPIIGIEALSLAYRRTVDAVPSGTKFGKIHHNKRLFLAAFPLAAVSAILTYNEYPNLESVYIKGYFSAWNLVLGAVGGMGIYTAWCSLGLFRHLGSKPDRYTVVSYFQSNRLFKLPRLALLYGCLFAVVAVVFSVPLVYAKLDPSAVKTPRTTALGISSIITITILLVIVPLYSTSLTHMAYSGWREHRRKLLRKEDGVLARLLEESKRDYDAIGEQRQLVNYVAGFSPLQTELRSFFAPFLIGLPLAGYLAVSFKENIVSVLSKIAG